MFRATTPKHSFIFDVDPEVTFKEILITYAQNGRKIVEKRKGDLEFDQSVNPDGTIEYIASVKLTQCETKQFIPSGGQKVAIQVRVLTYDGDAVAFEKFSIDLQDVLNDEVLK